MFKWFNELVCFFRMHVPVHVSRIFLVRNRPAPIVSYDGIPKDAQINSRIRLAHIEDIWEDHMTCARCGKNWTETDYRYGKPIEYNQMIYLENGQCHIVRPRLLEANTK